MSTIRVTCPHCTFNRDLPAEKLPDRPVQATCPRCKQSFEFQKPASPAPPPEPQPRPSPPPPELSGGTAPQSTPPKPVANKPIWTPHPSPPRLLEVGELFGEAWEAYRSRWMLLLGLLLVAAVSAALPPAIVAGGTVWLGKKGITIDGMVLVILGSLAAIAAFMAFFRGVAALIAAAVDDNIGFRDALARGSASWVALLWVSSLYGFIIGGASLLFLIPGILTSVWFFAAPYMAVAGDARGMEALLKSRAIVRGRFWPVLLRLFLVWLLGAIVGMIPVAGPLLGLLIVPFTILYQVILCRSLEESAGSVAFSRAAGDKARWLLLGLAGYLLVTAAIISIFGVSFGNSLIPLLKSGSAPTHRRQIITIPPPAGELPSGIPSGVGADGSSPAPATPGPTPTIEIGPGPGATPPSSQFRATDVSVFIYAVNAPGTVRINGQEFRVIKAEPDMQYNINAFGDHFRGGENTIEFDVTPRPGEGRSHSPRMHMKVSMEGRLLGEWRLSDKDGWPRSVTVTIPEGKSP